MTNALATADAPTPPDDEDRPIPALLVVGCSFQFDVAQPTAAVVMVEPHESEGRRIVVERFDPPVGSTTSTYRDLYGNQCRRLLLPPGPSTFTYRATVSNDVGFDTVHTDAGETDPVALPDDVLVFLLPSRYCPSDASAAHRLAPVRNPVEPGWSRVAGHLPHWVHDLDLRLRHQLATNGRRRLRARTGVCRDFAHLAITFCRALNIPARYVFGYLPDIDVPTIPPTDGLLRLDRGLPRRPVVDVRPPQQRAAVDGRIRHRPGTRRRRRRHGDHLRHEPTSCRWRSPPRPRPDSERR